ncbi:hypothetical protein POV27_06890 [Aureisphaera galaxeae]|uniref:DUF3298 domain-containing protein n=1 Tax=Aureisphaera galaxeae TaxID=1538023 RepID=UPI0023501565|nr:DUF3298 domain-containing protein [Aureisphaera galaxeae]MDC8003770.1 hypothetical protein [Aureisphaera galaxeae]
MKTLVTLSLLILFIGCKIDREESFPDTLERSTEIVEEPTNDSVPMVRQELDLPREESIQLKQQSLINLEDEKEELQELIIEKVYVNEQDLFTIDFHYPLLNESLKPSYVNFNEYINDYYVDIVGTEAGILEDKELLCDTLRTNRFREKRLIDYKIYNVNDQLVSILFYKENFYSGTLHPTYSFDCMNFDLDRSVFMNYDDFFIEGSEEEMRKILNDVITSKINEGEMYYDCWTISEDDFFEYKDNFVLDDYCVEYYFDDCVVCPSYTGSYSVRIPLEELLPVLRRYDINPLVF